MRDRWLGFYVCLFVAVSLFAYGAMALTPAPTVAVDGSAHSLADGERTTIDGRTYELVDLEAPDGEGGSAWSGSLEPVDDGDETDDTGDAGRIDLPTTSAASVTLVRGGLPRSVPIYYTTDAVSIGGETYAVQYGGGERVLLWDDVDRYENSVARTLDSTDRFAAAWWIVALSLLTAVLLVSLSTLPSKH